MQSGDVQIYQTPDKGRKAQLVYLGIFLSLVAGIGAYALYF